MPLPSLRKLVADVPDWELSDGFTIVIPAPPKVPAQLSAHLDSAKRLLAERGLSLPWDGAASSSKPTSPKAASPEDSQQPREESERRRSRSRERERAGEGAPRARRRRAASHDTMSSLPSGPELDISYARRRIKRLLPAQPQPQPQRAAQTRKRSAAGAAAPHSRGECSSSASEAAASSEESGPEILRGVRTGVLAPLVSHLSHGRTDVLPALRLEPHSAFLAAYRLTRFLETAQPDESATEGEGEGSAPRMKDALPLHLLPTFTPSEKRARRLALLLDADDRAIRDWAMEEYVKLGPAGRTLVSEGVFAVPSASSPTPPATEPEPESDFEDVSVSEAGGPTARQARAARAKADQGARGAALEALAARLEATRELAEESEELERERAWARETFGRWLRDGRAETVFREAARILDRLLRAMAREDGEEWAMASPVGPAAELFVSEKAGEDASVRPDESASMRDYGTQSSLLDDVHASGTETERAPTSGLETQVTAMRAPAPAAPAPLPLPPPAPAPATNAPTPAAEASKPAPPPLLRRTTSKREPAPAPELKRTTSKRDEGRANNGTTAREELKRKDSAEASKPQAKRNNSAPKVPAAAPAPPPSPAARLLAAAAAPSSPLHSRSPPQSTAQTNSQESQESGTSTVAPLARPTAMQTAPAPAQNTSYADFYDNDPRRMGVRDSRSARPPPAYAPQHAQPTPDQVFGAYADFYKGRSVAGSAVSRRSGRSDKKERDGKRRDREKEKEREKERDDRQFLAAAVAKHRKAMRSPSPDPLEDIAVSSRISLETGRLTTPGQSRVGSSGEDDGPRRPRLHRRSSAALTTPPQSAVNANPPPPQQQPAPKAGAGKPANAKTTNGKKGKAARLRGGAGSPSPPPFRRFGAVGAAPPASVVTQGPLIPLESDAGAGAADAAGEAAFAPLAPLPPVHFWMPAQPGADSDSDDDFASAAPIPPVFLALSARRACVPYTPAFQGLDMRVVRPVSARERLALRDAAAVVLRLGAQVEDEASASMWSLSYVGF